jgi:bifunctional non-homologous end joining protein LigD
MNSRYVIHRHRTGRTHYDLRVALGEVLRCWSLLREPPDRVGERRLAIERESFRSEDIGCTRFNEEAFGEGRVNVWDEGMVEVTPDGEERLTLAFQGRRLAGNYELRRTTWYPGNRWLLERRPVRATRKPTE